MALPIAPPITPMLSQTAAELPVGEGFLYEPKWDGFRAIIFKDGDSVDIQSRKGQPLARYFPEMVGALKSALAERAVIDGEIVVAVDGVLEFDLLSQRIHPADSRVRKLAVEWPSRFVAFDILALADDDLRGQPLDARRQTLGGAVEWSEQVFLTPQTADPVEAERWFTVFEGAGLDGVIAKHASLTYKPGERAMWKVKHRRTIDCVVGGYRGHKDGESVGSLLLGLFEGGQLEFVGHTSAFSAKERKQLVADLEQYRRGFPDSGDRETFGGGRTPGALSRWSAGKDLGEWVQLRPELVCEVSFERMQGRRFRHAARILRWRQDKAPEDCTFEQLEPPRRVTLDEVRRL